MIRKDDVKWWIAEAGKNPESAPVIIEKLAQRLMALDGENERLRDEIIRLEREGGARASGAKRVNALQEKVATLQALVDGAASDEAYVVFLSTRLQAARLPLAQMQQFIRDEQAALAQQQAMALFRVLVARPGDDVLLVTSRNRGLRVPVTDVPLLEAEASFPSLGGGALGENEWLTAATVVARRPRFWTLVTRRGFVRQLIAIDFDRRVAKGEELIESPFARDVVVALVSGDAAHLLAVSRWGRAVRFPQRSIPGSGAAALDLGEDDALVAAVPMAAEEEGKIVVTTAAGFAVRRAAARFEARPRPGGKGRSLIQAFDVLDGFCCRPGDRVLYLTYGGRPLLAAVDDLPLYTRSAKGARVYTLDRDPAVAVALVREG